MHARLDARADECGKYYPRRSTRLMHATSPGARAGLRERDVWRNKASEDSGRGGNVREDGDSVQRF